MKKIVGLVLLVAALMGCVAVAENPFAGMKTYEAGQYKVGLDMDAGEYVLMASSDYDGYFSVTSDANGNDILFNDNFETNSIIEVRRGEYVELKRCIAIAADDFYSEYSIKEGLSGVMLRVGYDIKPGEYKLIATSDYGGYYCIYPDARHDDIIANDNFDNSSYVAVRYGQYLVLSRCRIK